MPLLAHQIFTVSEINTSIKELLETAFSSIVVRGELKEGKISSNGHFYGKLSDGANSLSIVIWKSYLPQNKPMSLLGKEVMAYGRITSYPVRGDYQLSAYRVTEVGQGQLLLELEQLKQKLAAEGLFDPARKRPLPKFPQNIAVITSDSGAAVHDIISVLERRYPLVNLYLFPAIVQGDLAPASILQALKLVAGLTAQLALDVVIVGRGGGANEDLSAFNNEQVVRAAAKMPIPVISAVGHQINISLLDYAADKSAATPTAAAELAVPDIQTIEAFWNSTQGRISGAAELQVRRWKEHIYAYSDVLSDLSHQYFDDAKQLLASYAGRLENSNPSRQLWERKARFQQEFMALKQAMKSYLDNNGQQLKIHERRLYDLSPQKVMARGYAILLDDKNHQVVVDDLATGAEVTAYLNNGSFTATVNEIKRRTK